MKKYYTGKELTAILKKLEISQIDLSFYLRVSAKTVNRWIKNKSRMSEIYKVLIDDMLKQNEKGVIFLKKGINNDRRKKT